MRALYLVKPIIPEFIPEQDLEQAGVKIKVVLKDLGTKPSDGDIYSVISDLVTGPEPEKIKECMVMDLLEKFYKRVMGH